MYFLQTCISSFDYVMNDLDSFLQIWFHHFNEWNFHLVENVTDTLAELAGLLRCDREPSAVLHSTVQAPGVDDDTHRGPVHRSTLLNGDLTLPTAKFSENFNYFNYIFLTLYVWTIC